MEIHSYIILTLTVPLKFPISLTEPKEYKSRDVDVEYFDVPSVNRLKLWASGRLTRRASIAVGTGLMGLGNW